MPQGNRAYEQGGINTASMRWQPIPVVHNPDTGGMGDMLGFINSMYGQMQQGRQNQLENVLKAAQLQGSVEDAQARLKLSQELAGREALKSQLDLDLARQAGEREKAQFEQLPEREQAQRQFELDKATLAILPNLSDQTRGSVRLLNPGYAKLEDAQKAVEREKLLNANRVALKNADSPEKKKNIVTSITDPDIRMQLMGELEQESKKKSGGGADVTGGSGLLGALWNAPGAMVNVENRMLEGGLRGLTGQQVDMPRIQYTKPPYAAVGSALGQIPGNYLRALGAMSQPGIAVAPGLDALLRMISQRRAPEPGFSYEEGYPSAVRRSGGI